MRTPHLFLLELGRLLRSRIVLVILALTLLAPRAGLTVYRPLLSTSTSGYVTTMLGTYLANPALAAGVVGGALFALLTLLELDRVHRSRTDQLLDAILSPLTAALIRLWALLCLSLMVLMAMLLVWLPYTRHAAGAVFDGETYVLAYLIFFFPALPLSVLAAAAAYQFTRRFDLSAVLYLAFAALSLSVWSTHWQLCWLNPSVWAISDDFSNDRIFRSVAYMRLTWLLALAGLWGLSYLCIRRYGRGAIGSLAHSARRVYRPLLAVVLLAASATAYACQPFLDHSNPLVEGDGYYGAEYLDGVTCSERACTVRPDAQHGTLYGTAVFVLQNTTGQNQQLLFTVLPGYQITSVRANGQEVPFSLGTQEEQNTALLTISVPADPDLTLELDYGGFPQEWNLLETMQGGAEISERYMCLENEMLSPTLQNVMYRDETLPATIDICLPGQMMLVPFGTAEARLLEKHTDGTKTWRIEDEGYNTILYAGDYVCQTIEAAGLTIEFYYGRKHQAVMEQSHASDAIRQVVEYCTAHYGPLSFYSGGTLKLIQSRVTGGGYAGNGASTLDELDFTAQNLGNTDKGAAAGEVVIHELVHQWWGLGNMFDQMDQASAWSAEGLTVYTTYRIAKELYGQVYAQQNYVDQWQQAVDDYYLNFYVRNPAYLDALPEQYRADIANSLAQVRQYSEMPLKILKAEQLVGGEQAMDEILHRLFNRELDWTYPYLTYQEFLDACGLTEEDLNLA